jgi:hypothetical protein
MRNMGRGLICFSMLFLAGTLLFSMAQAQEDHYRLEHTDTFGTLRRPAVNFAHEAHVTALEEKGCGACHHAPDAETGLLVYVQDEEVSCSECHGRKQENETPALREAFHGRCNRCHRQMIKSVKNFKGPTTCGECHIPE